MAAAAGPDKNASFPEATPSVPSSAPAPAPKSRSCVVCSKRKVRCDKQVPCSNCRRANIACVFPSTHRLPKWTRRIQQLTDTPSASSPQPALDPNVAVDKVIERLQRLERLVKELPGQLEHAHTAAGSVGDGSSAINSPGRSPESTEQQTDHSPATSSSSVENQFGRLVLQGNSSSRYISSGFWSRVNDEVSVFYFFNISHAKL